MDFLPLFPHVTYSLLPQLHLPKVKPMIMVGQQEKVREEERHTKENDIAVTMAGLSKCNMLIEKSSTGLCPTGFSVTLVNDHPAEPKCFSLHPMPHKSLTHSLQFHFRYLLYPLKTQWHSFFTEGKLCLIGSTFCFNENLCQI